VDPAVTMFEVPTAITEKQFQRTLLDGFARCGYTTNHNQPTRAGDRWVTSGSPGFPDILATGHLGIVVVEVKGFRTPIDAAQIVWLEQFARGGAHAWILRPNSIDWHTIAAWIRNPTLAPARFGWTEEQYQKAQLAVVEKRPTIHHRRGRPS
jgi:hypothetical protein